MESTRYFKISHALPLKLLIWAAVVEICLSFSLKDFRQECEREVRRIDANPNIVEYARRNGESSNITFECTNILSKEFESKTFDIAIATLFFHHFSFEELVNILKKLHAQVRIGIVINDLHRHPLAYYSIKLLTRFFFKICDGEIRCSTFSSQRFF